MVELFLENPGTRGLPSLCRVSSCSLARMGHREAKARHRPLFQDDQPVGDRDQGSHQIGSVRTVVLLRTSYARSARMA
jgi:hypothetical protein